MRATARGKAIFFGNYIRNGTLHGFRNLCNVGLPGEKWRCFGAEREGGKFQIRKRAAPRAGTQMKWLNGS